MSAPPLPLGVARLLALRVLFGARNGLLYGVKVRAPHAAVLTALWAPGSARDKCAAVVTATARHAAALAAFATLYKTVFNALALAQAAAARRTGAPLSLQRLPGASGVGEPGAPLRAALAGALAGGFVFRRPTSVHQQIVLFLFSRATVGAARTFGGAVPAAVRARAWPLFAAGCWAATMSLWEHDKRVLAPGLVASMDFIYSDAADEAGLAPAAAAALQLAADAVGHATPPALPRHMRELWSAAAWRAALGQR